MSPSSPALRVRPSEVDQPSLRRDSSIAPTGPRTSAQLVGGRAATTAKPALRKDKEASVLVWSGAEAALHTCLAQASTGAKAAFHVVLP